MFSFFDGDIISLCREVVISLRKNTIVRVTLLVAQFKPLLLHLVLLPTPDIDPSFAAHYKYGPSHASLLIFIKLLCLCGKLISLSL